MKIKYQEALNELQQLSASKRQNELYDTLQELVDKETPKKLLKSQFDGYRECGNCKCIVFSTNQILPKYCSECGQRIDWSDEE